MNAIRKVFGVLGFGAIGVSVLVYTASFFGLTLEKHPLFVVSLHVGAFVLLVPMILLNYSKLRAKSFFWRGYGAGMPLSAVPILKMLGGLAIAHFLLFLLLTHATSPTIKDGQYVLDSHGATTKVLSRDESLRLKGWELRMFAAYWTFFYAVPALYWWFPRGSQNESATQPRFSAPI